MLLDPIVNIILQSLGGWLEPIAKFFTFLGTEEFYFLVMPVFYWCVSPMLGLRVALMLAFSNFVNSVLKLAFHLPRPYWVEPRVQALTSESSFGLPSGHAQNAAAVWGLVGNSLAKTWVAVICTALIVLIGLSRLYLGVHFLADVLSGWVIGLLGLALFLSLEKSVTQWINRLSFERLVVLSAAGAVIIISVILLTNALLGGWEPPAEWNANAIAVGAEPIEPRDVSGAFTLSGIYLGMTGGAAWMFRKQGGFSPASGIPRRALGYILGLVGVVIFWSGLGVIFPREADA
ncbi:MAG: phosphatase PAP2 family protein, partial [Anaerolineae bacterium]|nr:phosphatase PAP2 family protein [Anaerolineae bacterium]